MTDPEGDTAGTLRAAGIDTIAPLDSKEQITQGLLNLLVQISQGCAPMAKYREIERSSRKSQTKELANSLDAVNGSSNLSQLRTKGPEGDLDRDSRENTGGYPTKQKHL
jgi:hypothetical protein